MAKDNGLTAARRMALMSQHELGAKVGLTGQMISCFEQGRSRMTHAQMKAISKALGFAPEILWPDRYTNFEKQQATEPAIIAR